MDWHLILSFALMAAVIEISPGPNFLLITRSVTTFGKSVAMANIPGFSVAFMMHGALSIYGISAVISANPSLLLVVQLAGAAYLFLLGVQSIFTAESTPLDGTGFHNESSFDVLLTAESDCDVVKMNMTRVKVVIGRTRSRRSLAVAGGGQQGSDLGVDVLLEDRVIVVTDKHSYVRCFFDGFMTNILNPKITLFYLAAFPQFLKSGLESTSTSFLLVLIHVAINAVWFVAVARVLGYMLRKAQSDRFVVVLRRVSGYALIALSLVFVTGAVHAV